METIMKKIMCVVVFALLAVLTSCNSTNSSDIKLSFSELDWNEESQNNKLQEKITIDYGNKSVVYVYLYFPDISEFVSSYYIGYDDVKLIPRYLTSCPINYITDCKEDFNDLLIGTSVMSIRFSDIKNGGYFKYKLVTQKSNVFAGIVIGGEERIYDLVDIDIYIKDSNLNIYNEIVQYGMLLISYTEYSDEEIVSAFE
jgi:hypothetical protein